MRQALRYGALVALFVIVSISSSLVPTQKQRSYYTDRQRELAKCLAITCGIGEPVRTYTSSRVGVPFVAVENIRDSDDQTDDYRSEPRAIVVPWFYLPDSLVNLNSGVNDVSYPVGVISNGIFWSAVVYFVCELYRKIRRK